MLLYKSCLFFLSVDTRMKIRYNAFIYNNINTGIIENTDVMPSGSRIFFYGTI